MHELIPIIIAILILIAAGEFVYILVIRRSIRRLAEDFAERRTMDTNTGVSLPIPDPAVEKLAIAMNHELRELRKDRLMLQNGDLELKNTITNIAHDLRTPLTSINGYLELLEEEELSPKAASYLTVIQERTDTLKQLTEDMFRYTLVRSNGEEMELAEISLKKELESALLASYGMLTEKNILPEIQMPDTDVRRVLNAAALQRVFSNILTNVAKYSDGDLHVKLTETGKIVFTNSAEKLSKIEAQRLFDRYYTVQNARESTGIGLSIAKSLTEEMGGEICAEWKQGRLSVILQFSCHAKDHTSITF